MSPVLSGAATIAVGLLAIGLWAVARGPTLYDRMVAVAQATAATLALLVLYGFLSGRPELYLDIALTYGLLAMVVPIALSAYTDTATDDHTDDPDQPADPGRAERDERGRS